VQPLTPALRELQAHRPSRFVGVDPTTPFATVNPLPANVALRYGLFDARGYDFPIEERYLALWRRAIAPGCPILFCTTGVRPSPVALRALGLLSVTDVLQHPTDELVHERGLRLTYAGRDGRIYENQLALPRAFVVDRQVVAHGGEEALRTVLGGRFHPREAVVTERSIPGVSKAGPAIAAGAARPAIPARLTTYHDERAVVDVKSSGGVLVLTDTWYPGWKATVDGRAATIHRVDYLLRGVALPPGRHRVEFRYDPMSWRVGALVSVAALVVLLACVCLGLSRRLRTSPGAASITRP
jgi:hypothetical protein